MISKQPGLYEDLLYKRGFIFKDEPINIPNKNWKVEQIQQFWLGYDPINNLSLETQFEGWCALLGNVLDIFDLNSDSNHIASKLLNLYRSSFCDFLNYLDTLSGRFLLIISHKDSIKIFQDACGMRSVFYSNEHRLAASHLELLIENSLNPIFDEKVLSFLNLYNSYHLPGNITPYKNVFILTPNTYLDLNNKKVERFFPREAINQQDPQKVYEMVSELLVNQVNFLVKNYPVQISLTAGVDSRATLALLKEVRGKVKFFTYYKSNNNGQDEMISEVLLIDKKIAQEISQNLDLSHSLIEIDYRDQNGDDYYRFEQMMKRHTFLHHNHELAKLYFERLPHESLHIRSNINEVFRGFYRKRHSLPFDITPETMTLCYSKKAVGKEEIYDYFDKFAQIINFKNIYNYDPYDLFYWEYRLGVWHSNVLLESDLAFDSFCLFNNRFILKTIFSLPGSHPAENYILKRLINEKWPVLNYWPFNNENKSSSILGAENLSLEDGKVFSKSLDGKNIPVYFKLVNNSALFYMNITDPQKGDTIIFSKNIPAEKEKGYCLSFEILSPYEKRKYRGHLQYSVKLNGKIICIEDIADWGNNNFIQMMFKSEAEKINLEIEVYALRDCEAWKWGRAAQIILSSLYIKEISYKGPLQAAASSPFSKLKVKNLSNKLFGINSI